VARGDSRRIIIPMGTANTAMPTEKNVARLAIIGLS
jgi:hypothetical protein